MAEKKPETHPEAKGRKGRTMTGQKSNEILTEPTPAQVQKPEEREAPKLNNEVFEFTPPSKRVLHTQEDAARALVELNKKHPDAKHSIRQGQSGKFYVMRHTAGGQHIVAGG